MKALGLSFVALVVCVLCAELTAEARAPVVAEEDKLRVAVIVGIIRYTQWQRPLGDALDICVTGVTPSLRHLNSFHGQRVAHDLPLALHDVNNTNDSQSLECDVIIFGASPSTMVPRKERAYLSICDRCVSVETDAAVQLKVEGARVRFDVNLRRAQRQGVSFRSAMLELASQVEHRDD